MLAKINDLFARHGVNIAGQRLETRGRLGYALIDVEQGWRPGIVEELRRIPHTVRAASSTEGMNHHPCRSDGLGVGRDTVPGLLP